MISRSKRGNAPIEVAVIAVVVFAFAIVSLLTYNWFSDVKDDIVNDMDISSTAKEPIQNLHADYDNVFDTAFIVILIGLWVAAIISAFFIDTNIIFFGISVFALILVLAAPAVLGETFTDIFSDDSSGNVTDAFPITSWVMSHLLAMSIVMGGTILVSLYAKYRSEGF